MKINLAYGTTGLPIELPDQYTTVIEPKYIHGIPRENEFAELRDALRRPTVGAPLRERVTPQDTVAIVFCDITRAIPTARILPPLLRELELAGVPADQIILLDA